MKGCICVSRNNTEEIGEIIRALSLYYDIYIDRSELNTIKIRRRTMQKIIRNRIKCLKCGNIIESKRRHDLIWCSCGSCAVDGGTSYLKRVWRPDAEGPEEVFEEMSIVEVEMDSVEKVMSEEEK